MTKPVDLAAVLASLPGVHKGQPVITAIIGYHWEVNRD